MALAHANLPIQAPERVLPTLNPDGSRRWIRPRPSPGRFLAGRRALAWTLIAIFVALPYIMIGGKPAILLDLPRRQFTFFGATFLATDTFLFLLVFVSLLVGIFLLTALLGRVWCGWGCPQTVYMEFVFRPIERWIEGGFRGSQRLDARHSIGLRRIAKNAIFLVIAVMLAHVFLAYFVGVDTLAQWVRRSPVEHPTTFLLMLGTVGLIFFDFAYFREQTCLVACPYGRLQSVLLDRRSLIVGYDPRRGEPRARGVHRVADSGDCVDCGMCVLTCPTGIDIRDGLQMECIHCTQCIDACDAVMDKVGKPRGLIRYSSRDGFEARKTGFVRPRVVLYPLVLVATLGLFVWTLSRQADADVTVLRGIGDPYRVEPDGTIANQIRIKVTNRAGSARNFTVELLDAPDTRLVAPFNPLPVPAGAVREVSVFAVFPRTALPEGERDVRFRVSDGAKFQTLAPYRLVGPRAEQDEHEEREER